MKRIFVKIVSEFVIRFFPASRLKSAFLSRKYLRLVRFKGNNITLLKDISVVRPEGLVLGSDITVEGGGRLDATAGILIGDRCTVSRDVNISSVKTNGLDIYEPVVIGSGNNVTDDIPPGSILQSKIKNRGLSDFAGQIVFIVSTGRSGSKAIAAFLDKHPDAKCYHDSFPHIYPWSCDALYGREELSTIRNSINMLYNSADFGDSAVHGQSDQKLAPLIPLLAELLPEARFIWLIREADSFISSSYPRGWFSNSEFNYPKHSREFFKKRVTPAPFDAAHRTNGAMAGEMPEIVWKSMTAFERNCWYWKFWNDLIESHLTQLADRRWMMVKLEQLSDQRNKLFEFLGLRNLAIEAKKVNRASYEKISRAEWTVDMENIYLKHCSEGMKRWFGD